MSEEQLELSLDEDESDIRIYFEDKTLNADRVLTQALGKFDHVFLIGVDSEGASYFSDHGDVQFWYFMLERAKTFIERNSY